MCNYEKKKMVYTFFDIENHKTKETAKSIMKNPTGVYLSPVIEITLHNFPP